MSPRVYLDWNATAPLRPEAKAAMAAVWDQFGNPSSVHAEGRAARTLVENARTQLANAIGTRAQEIVFTSGGTESNALALAPGLVRRGGQRVERLIVSAIEHASVLAGGRFARERIERAPVDRNGIIDCAALTTMLASGPPALVSVMLANNETGAIQPVAQVADIVHAAGGLLHVDAVQALGKTAVKAGGLNADLISLSAHKVGGPKGVGALVVVGDLNGVDPAIRGGGQERGFRAGTENVAGIAAFGAAVAAAHANGAREAETLRSLQQRLETGLRATQSTTIFADQVSRLPNTTLVAAPGLRAETALIAFDLEGIALSSGSACSSGKVQPSHVLAAMGVSDDLSRGALRISWGWQTSDADIDRCLEAWRKLAGVLVRDDETRVERF